GSHVGASPSSLPVVVREGLSMPYGVQGFAPGGSGSSPRCAIQMRSGVSANTAPTDPQVQPACLTPSGPSGNGCGQFSTSSYGPNSSCPPFSCDTAAGVAEADSVDGGALQPARSAVARIASSKNQNFLGIRFLLVWAAECITAHVRFSAANMACRCSRIGSFSTVLW